LEHGRAAALPPSSPPPPQCSLPHAQPRAAACVQGSSQLPAAPAGATGGGGCQPPRRARGAASRAGRVRAGTCPLPPWSAPSLGPAPRWSLLASGPRPGGGGSPCCRRQTAGEGGRGERGAARQKLILRLFTRPAGRCGAGITALHMHQCCSSTPPPRGALREPRHWSGAARDMPPLWAGRGLPPAARSAVCMLRRAPEGCARHSPSWAG
jgi:hypothetical protein